MPDWVNAVRHKIASLDLECEEARQIFEELAGHLEESYQSLLSQGISEKDAERRALELAGDWQDLKRGIESARKKERIMNKRVTQFWLPAFVTLLLSLALLPVVQIFGPNPWVAPMPGGRLRMTPVAVVYVAWLVCLPLVGALGAYLSGRAGAGPSVVFSSIVFPVFPYVAFFVIGLPLVILHDHVANNIIVPEFFVGLAAWVIFPGAALMAGGLLCSAFHFSAPKR